MATPETQSSRMYRCHQVAGRLGPPAMPTLLSFQTGEFRDPRARLRQP